MGGVLGKAADLFFQAVPAQQQQQAAQQQQQAAQQQQQPAAQQQQQQAAQQQQQPAAQQQQQAAQQQQQPAAQQQQQAEEDRQALNAANTILVGAALIATITYATWVLLPFTDVTHCKAVKVFWVSNSLAFYLAIITVWLCVWAVWPYNRLFIYPFHTIKNRIRWPAFSFGLSYICVLTAYSSGAYIRVPKETLGFLVTDGSILGTIVVGVVLCVITIAFTLFLSYFR